MPSSAYRDFGLQFGPLSERTCTVRFNTRIPGAQPASTDVETVRFDRDKLDPYLQRLEQRQITEAELYQLGLLLRDLLLPGRIAGYLRTSLAAVRQEDVGLRLRLTFEAPELNAIPWEYTYFPPEVSSGHSPVFFLALMDGVSIARYEFTGAGDVDVKPREHYRMVIALSSPAKVEPRLLIEKDREAITSAIKETNAVQVMMPEWLEAATIAALEEKLKAPADILHFAGHGRFQDRVGYLIMCKDGSDGWERYDDLLLAKAVADARITMVVLSACEGAQRSPEQTWSGIAPRLAGANVAAVIASQFRLRHDLAIQFAQTLYGIVLAGGSVDAAVREARWAMIRGVSDVESRDWGAIVLYLRAPDGVLFPRRPVKTVELPPTFASRPAAGHSSLLRRAKVELIGRDQLLAELRDEVRRPDARLITLIGPPGVGKTDLALRVAQDLREAFTDGAHLVQLSSVIKPEEVLPTLGQRLGVPDVADKSALDALIEALSDKTMLLVLDTFEHLVDSAGAIASLGDQVPGLTLLVTSRRPLRIGAEREFNVPPLELPDLRAPLPPAEQLREVGAIALFERRGAAVDRAFVVTEQNKAAVVQICRRLDGIPLAIELAAARVRTRSPDQLVAAMGDLLPLLTGGARDRGARQETMEKAVEWSYQLMPEDERVVFRRLGIFSGGIGLDPAAKVLSAGDLVVTDLLSRLENLVDQSLLQRVKYGERGFRFRMLEPVRVYGLRQLEKTGEMGMMQRDYRSYYLTLAEQAEDQLRGGQRNEWLLRLDEEHDNLREVLGTLTRSEDRTDVGMALRLAGALFWFWRLRGYFQEGRQWLEQALARTPASADPRDRAKALYGAGALAWVQGEPAKALEHLEESVRLLRDLRDVDLLPYSLIGVGLAQQSLGRVDEARKALEESVSIFRSKGEDRWGLALGLNDFGTLQAELGHLDRAEKLLKEADALWRAQGDSWGLGLTLVKLGDLSYRQGDNATAQTRMREALELRRRLADTSGIAQALDSIGKLERRLQHPQAALEALREGLPLWQTLGNRHGIAVSLHYFGAVAGQQGDYERAAYLVGAGQELLALASSRLAPDDEEDFSQLAGRARSDLGPGAYEVALARGAARARTALDGVIAEALTPGVSGAP